MTIRVLQGDCRSILPTLPDCSVQCVVTSPPYFGLRNYGADGQIGLEKSPLEYVEQLVTVFREVRRVLRDDGTLWLNLGDSYASNGGHSAQGKSSARVGRSNVDVKNAVKGFRPGLQPSGFKVKDRLMIPARVAIALCDDGWWLRDEIVWHKPRPTPFPANDRTVNAHEMVYLLAKSPRYFFDWEAIEEPSVYPGIVRKAGKAFRDLAAQDPNAARKRPSADREMTVRETRRARSVWSICPSPYTDAHFATMPPDLAERCIRAGSRSGDTILDPFYGAGTTGMVADRNGRDCVGIEINPQYIVGASERMRRDAGLFADVSA